MFSSHRTQPPFAAAFHFNNLSPVAKRLRIVIQVMNEYLGVELGNHTPLYHSHNGLVFCYFLTWHLILLEKDKVFVPFLRLSFLSIPGKPTEIGPTERASQLKLVSISLQVFVDQR